MESSKQLDVLRRLGERKREIGGLAVNKERLGLWRKMNSLERVRPMVWINEIPWQELEAAHPERLLPLSSDPFLRQVETSLRREIFQWESFPCDMVVDPVLRCPIVASPPSSYADYGIKESVRREEGAHDVVYIPVLEELADAERIRTPEVFYDRAETERRLETLSEIFEGVMPVARRGLVHQWHSPWDQIIHWYGIERLYIDLCERPDLVHAVISRFTAALDEVLDRQIALGMLDVGDGAWRVGSGGLGAVDCLPERVEGRMVLPKDQWGCSNAQIFSEVSPDMHWEFSLQYELPILSRFGLSYYGCCEPLHRKFEILRRIPNLRKVSASPKADLGAFFEASAGDYVVSWKPNPAILACDSFDETAAARQIREAIEKSQGAPMEIIMKDISAVRGDPSRLSKWASTAMAVVQEA